MHEYLDFAGHHWPLFIALIVILVLIAIEEIRRRKSGARELEPLAAVQMLNRGAMVLDCREAGDYGKGHIVGSRNLPLTELDAELAKLKARRNKPAIAVGANPGETSRAAGLMRKAGFEAVYVLKGGLAAWRKQNLPLEQEDSAPQTPRPRKKQPKKQHKKK
ncbi:MAG: rhodanese-like domain-containing protein [Gammaproteobacteria bacterium]